MLTVRRIALAALCAVVPATIASAVQPPPTSNAVTYERVKSDVTGGFLTSPPRIVASGSTGQTIRSTLTILNQSGRHNRFTITIHDLGPGEGDTYSELNDPGSLEIGAGTWITIPATVVELDNSQEAHVPVIVTIPGDADAGGHYGAVAVEMSSLPNASKTDDTVAVTQRIVTDVTSIVPGKVRYEPELSKLKHAATAHGSLTVRTTVSNSGNIHTAPKLQGRIRGVGATEDVTKVDVPSILPGGEREVDVVFDDLPPLGRVTPAVTVIAEDGTKHTEFGEPVWVWSPVAAIVIGGSIVLGIAIVAAVAWRRRYRREWEAYLNADDDDDE
jgi:hypothetical protein